MLTYEELNKQNDHITELSNVLRLLLTDRFLCDSTVTAELFCRFVDRVRDHLEITDRKLYTQLLTSGDNHITTVANRFMGGSKEIKRIFAEFVKKWCDMKKQQLLVTDYDEFARITDEMFDMVLDRIQDEVEHLYPLLRKVREDEKYAA
ncbi:hemerythrin domain-containing protein [Thiolapillus sp.]